MDLFLLVLLFWTDPSFSHAFASPRPNPSGSPSTAKMDPTRLYQASRGTGLGYNSSFSQNTSGTTILPTITSQMNFSSTEHQRSYHMADKVCGSRTQEVVIWEDQDNIYDNYFNFTELCALWDSSCPGNKTLAKGMYILYLTSHPPVLSMNNPIWLRTMLESC